MSQDDRNNDSNLKKSEKPLKRQAAKELRNKTIIAMAMAGKSGNDIAKAVGITPQTVSVILNSDDVKARISDLDARLAEGLEDALRTVLEAVKTDYGAARDLLRNFGAMQARVQLEHKGLSLEELVAGSNEDSEE